MNEARAIIQRLGLARHPEGGWYRETWRAAPEHLADRDAGTAILFLLEEGQSSHWHRVDAAELWMFHAGSPLRLRCAERTGLRCVIQEVRLGPDVLNGELPQFFIPPDAWQAAHADNGWTLVSCVVVPGFSFEGFELAPPDWSPELG